MSSSNGRITVVHLCGHGRSGTTLLDMLLSSTTGGISVGEMHRLWVWGIERRWKCSCGSPVPTCDFWNQVFQDAYGRQWKHETSRAGWLWRRVARPQHLPLLLLPGLRTQVFRDLLAEYRSHLYSVFQAVQSLTSTPFLIDSSGSVIHGAILGDYHRIDYRPVHLVRDARAVAFSNTRDKPNPADPEHGVMATKPPFRTALSWTMVNLLAEGIIRQAEYSVSVKYEDLCRSPQQVLEDIGEHIAIPVDCQRAFVSDDTVKLNNAHMPSGNPARFNSGQLTVRLDSQWKEALRSGSRVVVTGLTFPLLGYYGYLGRKD